jgi:hypothetical protein
MDYFLRDDGEYVVRLDVDGQPHYGYARRLSDAIRDLADAMDEAEAEEKGNE